MENMTQLHTGTLCNSLSLHNSKEDNNRNISKEDNTKRKEDANRNNNSHPNSHLSSPSCPSLCQASHSIILPPLLHMALACLCSLQVPEVFLRLRLEVLSQEALLSLPSSTREAYSLPLNSIGSNKPCLVWQCLELQQQPLLFPQRATRLKVEINPVEEVVEVGAGGQASKEDHSNNHSSSGSSATSRTVKLLATTSLNNRNSHSNNKEATTTTPITNKVAADVATINTTHSPRGSLDNTNSSHNKDNSSRNKALRRTRTLKTS